MRRALRSKDRLNFEIMDRNILNLVFLEFPIKFPKALHFLLPGAYTEYLIIPSPHYGFLSSFTRTLQKAEMQSGESELYVFEFVY